MTNKYWFVLLASLSIFMELFDATVLYTSLITIAQHFNVNVLDLKAAVIYYFIGISVCVALSSYLVSVHGEKKVFIFACLIFTLSSLACGLATTIFQLSLFRFVQGIGASFLSPVAIMMAFRALSSEHVVKVSSLINIPGLVGAALGPFVGGVISTYFYWGWIFFINVPIGLFLMLLCHFVYCKIPLAHTRQQIKFDKIGFISISAALLSAAIFIEKLNDDSFNAYLFNATAIICVLSVIFYYLHYQKMREKSLVDLSIFKIRSFKSAIFINIIARISISGVAFSLPLFLQQGLGFSAKMAGFYIMFIAIGAIFSKFFLSPFITLHGYTKALSVSAVILAISILLFTFIGFYPYGVLIIILCLSYGIINSFQYTSMNSLILKDIHSSEMRKAVNIHAIVLEYSNILGISIAAYIIAVLSEHYQITLVTLYQTVFIILAINAFTTIFIVNSKPTLDINRQQSN